jgi:Protein-L-isoaspartate(D-aspartate) O-methyltransferase (PCMT)
MARRLIAISPAPARSARGVDADIVQAAQHHLICAGFKRVEVICGDGAQGYPLGAPYDRIILTVCAWDIAPAWWGQLVLGGRLVIPLALRGPEIQRAIAFDRMDDHLVSESVRPCGFMLLRGAFAGPTQQVPLGLPGACGSFTNTWPLWMQCRLSLARGPLARPSRRACGQCSCRGGWPEPVVGTARGPILRRNRRGRHRRCWACASPLCKR